MTQKKQDSNEIVLKKIEWVDVKVTQIVTELSHIAVELTESNRRAIETEKRLNKIESKQWNHSKWIFIQWVLLVIVFIIVLSLIPTL